MAIRMTRAEYEKKYGVAPVVSTSTLDIAPAPRRMTRAQYEQEYGLKKPTPSNTPISDLIPGFDYDPQKTGLSNIPKAIANIPRELGRAVESTVRLPFDIFKTVSEPSVRQYPGAAASGFAETAYGATLKPIVDVLQGAGNTFLGQVSKTLKDTTGLDITSPETKKALDEINPNLYNTVQAIQQMLVETPLATAVGGRELIKPQLKRAEVAVKEAVRPVLDPIIQKRNEAISAQVADEIYNIENNYSKLRNANDRASDAGAASRARIAQTDVLAGSVDDSGTIRTKQPGGAVDKYFEQTLAGKEGVVRDTLVNEGKKISISQVERDLRAEIGASGLEGGDLVQALRGIENEIEGLRKRADELDRIELAKVHDAKINATRHVDYNSPVDRTYRKALARGYKQIVEENSSTDVRAVNAELAKYYKDIERLEGLDGRKARGGRLGKYAAQIAGNIAGAAVGHAVGGTVGMAAGTIVGGETARLLSGKQMAGTFGRERGVSAPRNPILERAAERAKGGPQIDLKKPDVKVGAPRGVEKTKDILKIERQISDNVEAQKSAIKKGDFTLVAALKEIYKALVEKLKELIKKAKTGAARGFIRGDATIGGGKQSPKTAKTPTPKQDSTEFEGFQDLSTKLLEKLKGRTTVSRQFIEDLSNSPDLKQAERDLIRRVLDESKIPAFRGGSLRSKEAIESGQFFAPKGEPMWFSKTREVAEKYGEHIAEADMSSFKFLDTSELSGIKTARKIAERAGLDERYSMKDPKFIAQLQKEGYDGLIMGNGNDYAILNPNAQIGKSPTISVPDFANKVKSELLPLERRTAGQGSGNNVGGVARYENITLPDELRGPISNYSEHLYSSPIKTSAGSNHFGHLEGNQGSKNYFAHTRIEDLPNNLAVERIKHGKETGWGVDPDDSVMKLPGNTRRVIELQSDLFQKGRLEQEYKSGGSLGMNPKEYMDMQLRENAFVDEAQKQKFIKDWTEKTKVYDKDMAEIAKLEPYRNTWHERVIREEVKQAAKDGKTKLQFPTGETAMKIEGLGQSEVWSTITNRGTVANLSTDAVSLKPGMSVFRAGERGQDWIITDVLGDGKFKAVPKNIWESKDAHANGIIPSHTETFDISGKVDTNNPIYKFYEKEVGKYLKNKYNAQLITDAQGVKWWEVDLKGKGFEKAPVEAFGVGAVLLDEEDSK